MDNRQALKRQSTQERIMRTQRLLNWACGAVLLCLPARAADWPQWRGPQRNGVSSETGLLKEWPKEGPRLVWQGGHVSDLPRDGRHQSVRRRHRAAPSVL